MKATHIGIVICIVLTFILAWFAMTASLDTYWIYLIAASLLGVAVGVLRNLDRWGGGDEDD